MTEACQGPTDAASVGGDFPLLTPEVALSAGLASLPAIYTCRCTHLWGKSSLVASSGESFLCGKMQRNCGLE